MAEEQTPVAPAETPPVDTGVVQDAPPATETPEGTDFVDFKSLPPEVEARFRRIYRNMKEFEQSAQLLAEQNRQLDQRLRSFTSNQDVDRARDLLGDLRQQKIKALETANYAEVAKLDEQIAVLAPRIAESTLRHKAPPVATEPAAPKANGLSREEVQTVAEWASRTDANGNFLRPWALPNHPKHNETIRALTEISQEPEFKDVPIETILRETDKRMAGRRPPTNGTAVLASGSTRAPAATVATLTPAQKQAAEKMFMPTKLAKTPAEAHKLYADQLKMGV